MIRNISVVIAFLMLSGCNAIFHDEDLAAKAAQKFAHTAIIDREIEAAYQQSANELKAAISSEDLEKVVVQMHPKSRPVEIVPTHFEPIPGQEGMFIRLYGSIEGEEFYYRARMVGTGTSGYKVAGFFRGSEQYPITNMVRPLSTEVDG